MIAMKKPNQDLERLLTVREVAHVLAICERTVRRRIKSGDLPAVRDGRLLRVRPIDLRSFQLRKMLQ
jgi:excisionase family DNA binding protein